MEAMKEGSHFRVRGTGNELCGASESKSCLVERNERLHHRVLSSTVRTMSCHGAK